MSRRKPNYTVCGKTLAGTHWKPIGVAFAGKSREGTPYVSVRLDFWPTTGMLTLWPVDASQPDDEPDDEDMKALEREIPF